MAIDWKKFAALSEKDKKAVKLLAWFKNYFTGSAAYYAAVHDPVAARKRYGSMPDTYGMIALGLEWGAMVSPFWKDIEPKAKALITVMVMEALKQVFKIG